MTLSQILHQPDPVACGCDNSAVGLVPVDQALARGASLVRPISEVESLPLDRASGRILAEDIAAPVALPLFDNAAMDGYALRLGDLTGQGPWRLPVAGRIRAGDPAPDLPDRATMRILTGAPTPQGADVVIAQENLHVQGTTIVICKKPVIGQHIRRAGDDLDAGMPLLARGSRIGPCELAALAGVGIAKIGVLRRIRVAILCSGNELAAPGAPLHSGQIWDVNHPMLMASLDSPWIDAIPMSTCKDDPEALQAALSLAATQADIVVTTGGVSVGDEDYMARVIVELGGHVAVSKLAMKPGKPLSIGRIGVALWLGLPGNPVAAFVTWHVVGQVLAGRMAGLAVPGPEKSLGALVSPIRHKPGRCEYRPAQILGHDARGVLQVACLEGAGSHRVAQLSQADALVMIPSDLDYMARGDLVELLPL